MPLPVSKDFALVVAVLAVMAAVFAVVLFDADRFFAASTDPHVKALASILFRHGVGSRSQRGRIGRFRAGAPFLRRGRVALSPGNAVPQECGFADTLQLLDGVSCTIRLCFCYRVIRRRFVHRLCEGHEVHVYGVKYRYFETDRMGSGIGEKPEDVGAYRNPSRRQSLTLTSTASPSSRLSVLLRWYWQIISMTSA